MPEKIMILWSGGIDSTAVLKQYLEKTDYEVVVNHIHYSCTNNNGREDMEDKAIDIMLPILQEIRSFEFVRSVLKYESNLVGVFDVYLLGLHVLPLAYYKKCKNIIIGFVSDIRNNQRAYIEKTTSQLDVFSASFGVVSGWDFYPRFIQPMYGIYGSKGYYISQLGEMVQHTWFCRSPRKVQDGEIGCGECHTCLHVKRSIEKREF